MKDVKKYRKKKDFKRYSRPTPGDRLQIDVTKIKAKCYQFTAIDDCTRIKVARIYPNKKAESSLSFLLEIIDYLGELGITIQRVQTDCGKEFYNEAFQLELMEHFIKFRPNPPGKPHLNGKVERGQKTDKEEFYRTLDLKIGIDELKNKLSRWEHFYNFERPHSSLNGRTPIEFLEGVQSKIPPQNTVTTAWWESEEKIKTLVWEKYKKSLNK